MIYPPTPTNTKKPMIFTNTIATLTLGSARLVITVKAIIPRISSITAAPRIAFPAFVFSFPISFKVSTEILTLVAVKITPMKKFWSVVLAVAVDSIIPGRLKIHAIPYPPTRGINTPISAMIKDAFPVLFNSPISVSSPAQNISTITPISET